MQKVRFIHYVFSAKNGQDGFTMVHEHAKCVSIAGEDTPDRLLLQVFHSPN